jgi:hypothetical protein
MREVLPLFQTCGPVRRKLQAKKCLGNGSRTSLYPVRDRGAQRPRRRALCLCRSADDRQSRAHHRLNHRDTGSVRCYPQTGRHTPARICGRWPVLLDRPLCAAGSPDHLTEPRRSRLIAGFILTRSISRMNKAPRTISLHLDLGAETLGCLSAHPHFVPAAGVISLRGHTFWY